MATIRDRINAWADENVRNAGVMTRSTEAYNHMQEAVQKLLSEPWVELSIGKDMPPAGSATDETKVK